MPDLNTIATRPPNADTILAESLRAAADYRREQIAAELGLKISEVMNG